MTARLPLACPVTVLPNSDPGRTTSARRAAIAAATTVQRQLRALVITAPEKVRARFRGQSTREMLTTAPRLRPGTTSGDVHTVTALSVLRAPARGVRALEAEAGEHERAIRAIVRAWRPDLLDLSGVGPTIAATALAAWSHPGRSRSDAAFAILAGAAPIPASSGKTVRYRLNRSGNQQLNRAMHNIALSRLRFDPDTRTFADTRRARARPTATSNAATSAIYPASSTDSPNQEPERLTNHSDT